MRLARRLAVDVLVFIGLAHAWHVGVAALRYVTARRTMSCPRSDMARSRP